METQYSSSRPLSENTAHQRNTDQSASSSHLYHGRPAPASAQLQAHSLAQAAQAHAATASFRRDDAGAPPREHQRVHERERDDFGASSARDSDTGRDSLRDFVHTGPPPLRRLSAPSASAASNQTSSSSSLPTLSSFGSHSTLQRGPRSLLPPPSLAPRAHAPPPAITIPTARYGRAYAEPQTAPLVPPPQFTHHLQPPRSAVPRPRSPGPYTPTGVPPLSGVSASSRHSSLLAPPYYAQGHSSSSATSSPIGYDERALRSPHPPLTAIHSSQYPWAPHHHPNSRAEASVDDHYSQRPYLTSPLGDVPPTSAGGSYYPHRLSASHAHSTSHHGQAPPLSPAYLSAPPLPPLPYSARPTTDAHARTHSPLHIPPPLQFKYSASPPHPPHAGPSTTIFSMPPRRKAAGSTTTITSTPQTASSARSSRRVAGSATGAKGNGWTTEHTYDSVGQPKEIIVIQDSTSPIPKKRTRAAAAAAAAAEQSAKWITSANGAVNGSGAKKRKVEEDETAKKKQAKAVQQVPPVPPLPVAPAQPAVQASGSSQQPSWDDAEGHYIVTPDDIIGGRYKIVRLLGQGTFGKVVEARHIESRKKVAIKVIRAVQKYRDASKIEIRVLEALKKNDPTNAHKCIHLTEYFDFRNHPCLVSELYGMSVFDFLKINHFQPFPEKHIQDFAKSLLQSVQFLHSLKLVHTDLKPENILLVSNESRLAGPRRANARSKSILRNTEIRLIDFGSATFENEYHSSVVSTRHYRAPEIILGLPWSYPCDLFSIGCILVEFFTGDALFQTHDNLEHLAMMEVVMGKMPPRMIERGRLKKPEFFKGNKIDFPNPSVPKSSRKFVKGLKALKDIIPSTNTTNALFLDLIVRLLDFDPETRIDVNTALKHPYLRTPIAEPA